MQREGKAIIKYNASFYDLYNNEPGLGKEILLESIPAIGNISLSTRWSPMPKSPHSKAQCKTWNE